MNDFLHSETTAVLVQKIGTALCHSVWIGAIAALLAAVVVMLTRRSKPEIRYNLLAGLLVLFVVATGLVFFLSSPTEPIVPTLVRDLSATSLQNEAIVAVQVPNRPGPITIITSFLNRNLYIITLLWLIIVTVKISGLALDLYRMYQLKTRQIYSIGQHWEQRVAAFAHAMGIDRTVRVFQSGLVKVPTVLGHFKPVILVPLGVITSIPAEQIEMILLHELAHIRRLDFFVNLLQRITELLFFFNPGLLWISKLIREERENCCDDMALSYSGNKTIYIQALLSFREYQLTENVYQLAFASKTGLVQRVKRIASRSNSTLGVAEKTVLLVAMLAFFTFSIIYAQSRTQRAQPKKTGQTSMRPDNGKIKPTPLKTGTSSEASITNPATPNTDNQPIKEKPVSHVSDPDLTSPDTLQPLQTQLSPLYQATAPVYMDSSGNGRLVPVLRQTYVQTYKMQPLQTYQPLYDPRPLRTKPLAFTETILNEIERQGIAISRNNIEFKITNQELIINGVKQPLAVHQGVLDAVLKSPTDTIDFTYGRHK
ncbi:M56 family metallopeptidase [Dyadobacter sp. MSC1_007]|jgi:bla regulator protein BlaR1|uniref:M56 family metallopeptidase n=1 Tax=Dyadobacter sp. MSC1_007 TaxID=2909264 RepID=UPI0020308AC0|nr:M56 family metallopeptidase [Dyadobacter sp. MSC1_007]